MQIDMKDRPDGRHARMEKYLLRKAFDCPEQPYLPEDVLWRQKEQFSDGVGYSWVDGLKDYANKVGPSCLFCPVAPYLSVRLAWKPLALHQRM